MLTGQVFFIIGVISVLAGFIFSFNQKFELIIFGIFSIIAGVIWSMFFWFYDEPTCQCELCNPKKFNPNDYK